MTTHRPIDNATRARAVKAIADGRLSIAPIFGENGIHGWEIAGEKAGKPHSLRVTTSSKADLPDELIAALLDFDAMLPN